ncbi:hypothetical protein LCGC14_0519440 [marine sediment metagenome]|uniref:Uncharacterized protein n=1 Tax=marine sediment metagenome TaxID=412755 RepID=A0A0F9S3L6_9ZZZZ|nr:MAG: hypothetical protein Lokiarch_48500 [Candidatus Lokiarchaeum sp. GC14_75]
MSESYIEIINSLLDDYIERRELGDEIYDPLNILLSEIQDFLSEVYLDFNNSFLKKSKNEDITNFLFYHSTRNLRLTTIKVIDSFKLAKVKALNPKVARQLRSFIEPLIKFLMFLKLMKQETLPKIDMLSEELEKFRSIAKENDFLCNIDEELKYDKITHKEFRSLMDSIREINLAEFH